MKGKTASGWSWDVKSLVFYDEEGTAIEIANEDVISSGACDQARYKATNATTDSEALKESIWGGRQDENGELWIGANFGEKKIVSKMRIDHHDTPHLATSLTLQYRDSNVEVWVTAKDLEQTPEGAVSLSLIHI